MIVDRGGGLGVASDVAVDDPDDPRLIDYRSLTDVELRVRYEGDVGVFIAEGPLAVRELLTSPYDVRSVLVTPSHHAKLGAALDGLRAPVYVASEQVLDAIAGFHLHRGALACGVRRELPSISDVLATARVVCVLERINDHENLGAIFRNARALGVDAVLLCPECCDPFYRRAIRVSMGHLLHVPIARTLSLPAALGQLHDAGFTTVALTPDPSAEPVHYLDGLRGHRVALLLGAEGPGLRATTQAGATRRVRIPMRPDVDSLNVGTAAAIAFHRLLAEEPLA
ncbi:MAG TPA: RNA methyltransferase [Mycobacteriales bacterium]|nr:RNA methyltransferase [Mycobacteriales bacterium]